MTNVSRLRWNVQNRPLGSTELTVSQLGFGCSPLGNEFGAIDESGGARAVQTALDLGINFFDVAPYYGRGLAEHRLGAALAGRRHGAVISTKCARFDVNRFNFSAESARASIDESLQRLRTDYVDIFHVHDVEFGDLRQISEETVPALREIQQSGKARYIGITGLALKMLREIATAAPVDCMLSYCRYNLLNRDLEAELAPFAKNRGIGLINASPLHMGLLSDSGPPPWHPSPAPVKVVASQVVELCRRRGVKVSAVALRFALDCASAATTLVGMHTEAQVKENLAAAARPVDGSLQKDIEAITRPVQHIMWITGKPENH